MKSTITSIIKNKCKNIKIILTDVDGVLTDGGRYYSEKGETLKKFHVRDGMGVNILLRNGIKTIIVTKENSKITKKWAKEMNVTKVISGSIKKEAELSKICQEFNVSKKEFVEAFHKNSMFSCILTKQNMKLAKIFTLHN